MNTDENLIPIPNSGITQKFSESIMNQETQTYISQQMNTNSLCEIKSINSIENPIHKTNELIKDQTSVVLELRDQLNEANKEIKHVRYQLMKASAQNEVLLKIIDEKSEKLDYVTKNNKELRDLNAKMKKESMTKRFLWAVIPSLVILAIEHIFDIYSIISKLINRI